MHAESRQPNILSPGHRLRAQYESARALCRNPHPSPCPLSTMILTSLPNETIDHIFRLTGRPGAYGHLGAATQVCKRLAAIGQPILLHDITVRVCSDDPLEPSSVLSYHADFVSRNPGIAVLVHKLTILGFTRHSPLDGYYEIKDISAVELAKLCTRERMPNLTSLTISLANISSSVNASTLTPLSFSHIRDLYLYDVRLHDDDTTALSSSLPLFTNLTSLHIAPSAFFNPSLEQLINLRRSTVSTQSLAITDVSQTHTHFVESLVIAAKGRLKSLEIGLEAEPSTTVAKDPLPATPNLSHAHLSTSLTLALPLRDCQGHKLLASRLARRCRDTLTRAPPHTQSITLVLDCRNNDAHSLTELVAHFPLRNVHDTIANQVPEAQHVSYVLRRWISADPPLTWDAVIEMNTAWSPKILCERGSYSLRYRDDPDPRHNEEY